MKRIGLIILLSIYGQSLLAQDDSTTRFNVEILTKYNPVLSSAKKIVVRPVLEPLTSNPPVYTYDLPNFGYKVLPTYQPAEAIDLKFDEMSDAVSNYVKLGGGNYLTPYAEFQLHSVAEKKFSYGAYGKHLSSNAGDPKNADFSDNELGVFGSKITKKGDLTGKLNYERHVVHQYGYNEDSFNFEKGSINQIYNDFNGRLTYDNGTIRKKTAFKTAFDFYTFSNIGGRENDFKVDLETQIDLRRKSRLDINAYADYTTYQRDTNSLNRFFVGLTPQYGFTFKKFDFRIGANVVVTGDSNTTKLFVFPALDAEHFIVKDKVKAFAHIGGDVKKTSLRQLSYLNPFVRSDAELQNTINSFAASVGLRGIVKNRLDYLLKVDYSLDNNMPLYVSDTTPTRPFTVVYDNVQTLALQAGIGIRIDEKFKVQVAGTFYNYNTDAEAEAWQLPSFDADVNLQYTLAKKLNLRLQLYAFGNRWQVEGDEASQKTQLSPFADIDLMADYRYKKNLSFFLNLNNISNARYQKWYNYPVYGLNILAGVTFSL